MDRAARQRELSELFYDEYRGLWSLAYAILGDPHAAEEIAMEAFVKAYSSWGRLRRMDWPGGYLRKIVVNLSRSKLRRRIVELRVNALSHRGPEAADPSWDDARSDARIDVLSSLRDLPPRQSACIVLRYMEDMTLAEIAAVLDCSVGTVKSHLFRARRTLESALSTTGGKQ